MSEDRRQGHIDFAERMARVETRLEDLDGLKEDMRAVRQTLSEAKGGWRRAVLLAGVGGAVGALLMKFIPIVGVFK